MIVVVRVRTLLHTLTVDGPEVFAVDDIESLTLVNVPVVVDRIVVLGGVLEENDPVEDVFGTAETPVVELVAAELDEEGEAPVA